MSHGKGACHGIGGTIKSLARKAILQNPYEQQIMTARQL
jgi:exopolyphosphatase/pppGpp-phosphohydrolase